MFSMEFAKHFWEDAVLTEAYLINRMRSSVFGNKPPIELLCSTSALSIPPKVFGCVGFVHDHGRSKKRNYV